ncbi:PREDICTED: centrosomin [Ceratosolen solmsi marchali]|uniref:Centrosomin n=1 Tax=Ceratosolen solmsi marchali TaxID=326594 RepID=A0AAJ6VKY5_9HYME|nr:PREDICTED: centrosomin [Ceratosolen solmsi marchali]
MANFSDDTMASINYFDITNLPLPNITMDQSVPTINSASLKTPGKTSPLGIMSSQGIGGPGRTMKECEDHLGILKKENFNLKLRIYFLEERMGITSADEDAIKKNIELKVENESLKKELIEKQELLSQAAKAIELIEEQKQVYARNETQYQQTLEQERERVNKLEKELEDNRLKLTDITYYEETFGITPEKALEYEEKLHKVEEIKSSLESELKQLSASLEEERNWAQELENERDQLKNRLESKILCKEKLSLKRDREMEVLSEKLKVLEEQAFKTENLLQQFKKEIIEKNKIIDQKSVSLEEKSKAYDEVSEVAEKRKKQIDQLRLSIKSRDDALTDLNSKNRSLLSQFENNSTKRSLSSDSQSTFMEESQNFRRICSLNSPTKSFYSSSDLKPSIERTRGSCDFNNGFDKKDIQELKKELDDRDRDIKKKEETKKQLMLKLYSVQQSADVTDQKLKKLEIDHKKAIQMIQGFLKRHEQLEDKQAKKDRRIMDLEVEVSRLQNENTKAGRSSISTSMRKNSSNELIDGPERDHNTQQRFEEMESKINDLQNQIAAMKAGKNILEKRIQIETDELLDRLQDKDLKIESLQYEKNFIKDQLQTQNEELYKLKEICNRINEKSKDLINIDDLRKELIEKNLELEERKNQIDHLTKELLIKTQNLQQLVNTELWSKNKEIAKLHNHITSFRYLGKIMNKSDITEYSAIYQLNALIKELNNIGIQVSLMNDIIQLNYINSDKSKNVLTITNYIHKLVIQKNELEKEVDYLKWLKFISKPINKIDNEICNSIGNGNKHYYVLKSQLKKLVKFMNDMLKSTDQTIDIVNSRQKIVFDVLINSKTFSDNFMNTFEGIIFNESNNGANFDKVDRIVRTDRMGESDNFIEYRPQFLTTSNSETFSKSDKMVLLAKMDLLNIEKKFIDKPISCKFLETFSDSGNSINYYTCHGIYQSDVNEKNNFLYSELNVLRNGMIKNIFDDVKKTKLSMLLTEIKNACGYCEKLQNTIAKEILKCPSFKKEGKQNSHKIQLGNKHLDVENISIVNSNQKVELFQYKNNTDRKANNTINSENEVLRAKIMKLDEENKETKTIILRLTKELDHLTLNHSQILVENTKLTNEKLRLEQDIRKSENGYDIRIQTLRNKFYKEVSDLNQINELYKAKIQELEIINKKIQRNVIVCETSDSTPSSSGISSFPFNISTKQICEDIHEYNTHKKSHYWLPVPYTTFSDLNKSSCSPDLGIESDAIVTSIRPFKDTLKITESMTNLLSDDENYNIEKFQSIDGSNLLNIEDLEVQTLKQENVVLKKRLIKTRRALEDTFQHLSASNKNKKNVEKAITKQLMITKSILKKTRNYEDMYRKK